jgi:hypothetical protein
MQLTSNLSQFSKICEINRLLKKTNAHIFLQTSSKCPQNGSNRNKRKSVLFVVAGAAAILLGMGLILDKQLDGYVMYSMFLVAMGIIVLLAGLYGVCFLNNLFDKKELNIVNS